MEFLNVVFLVLYSSFFTPPLSALLAYLWLNIACGHLYADSAFRYKLSNVYMKGNFTESFGLVKTNASEVISIVKCFNTKPSAGYDDIPKWYD